MKERFYFMPMVGTGTMENPYRVFIDDQITWQSEEYYRYYQNKARMAVLCFVHAEEATHLAIEAFSEVTPVSELYDEGQIANYINKPLSAIPNIINIKAKLEENGYNTQWANAGNTLKDAMRYILRISYIAQRVQGEREVEIVQFIKNNLATQMKDISPAIRTKVSTWMQNKGLAVGWINNDTTVREVLHFIVMNLGIGVVKFVGEEF